MASRSPFDASRAGQIIDQVREAAKLHLGVQLREVQVRAGRLLLESRIAEMQTGEGKTLTTVLPAASLAASKRKVLIATANDYLASRDAQWMGPLYQSLGITVGCVSSDSRLDQRKAAYDSDVTYGTLREFAFDFLRSSLASRQPRPDLELPFSFDALIIDEADSLLIDEARTPLVITAPTGKMAESSESCFRWAARHAASYRLERDYIRLPDSGAIALTEQGRQQAIGATMPTAMASLTTTDILHSLERAIWVNETIQRDHQYVVKEGQIQLIDEYTGRQVGERNFGGGIHQAVEAREGLSLTLETDPVARISIQDFVTRFAHLSGMTATAWEDRHELRNVYGLTVSRVPPHQPSRRKMLAPAVCRSLDEKWLAIAGETDLMVDTGRAVLIGTRTIAQSEMLSSQFASRGIQHVVLNARNPAQEAAIIAAAGESGRVTIATNMAGRGTDIQLADEVAEAGGLHVIVSEPHAASRVDRQLVGRSARQGDPGSARLFASPADEIFSQAYGDEQAEQIRRNAPAKSDRWLLARVHRAQRRVARRHRAERSRLTAHDAGLAEAMRKLGLDPHLDPLPEIR